MTNKNERSESSCPQDNKEFFAFTFNINFGGKSK